MAQETVKIKGQMQNLQPARFGHLRCGIRLKEIVASKNKPTRLFLFEAENHTATMAN